MCGFLLIKVIGICWLVIIVIKTFRMSVCVLKQFGRRKLLFNIERIVILKVQYNERKKRSENV